MQKHPAKRRGVIVVFSAVALILFMGFAALALDIGLLCTTKGQLQNAADAAALAGASVHGGDSMREVRLGTLDLAFYADASSAARQEAQRTGLLNETLGNPTFVEPTDVTVGWLDLGDDSAEFRSNVPRTRYNAVQVTTRRSEGFTNGAVQLMFAPVMGWHTAGVEATAVAVFEQGHPQIAPIPFSIERSLWETETAIGADDYSYDPDADAVYNVGDGIPEVVLFPNLYAPGNFGALRIGPGVADPNELGRQIKEGISDDKLNHTFGEDYPGFRDENGDPKSYSVEGATGIMGGMEPDIESRVGDIVGVFVHEGAVEGSGGNATYNIIEIRYARLMYVNLSTGDKGIWVQPAPGYDSGTGTPGRLRLAR